METSDIAHETSSTKLLQKYFILPLPNAGIPTTRGAHLDSVHRPDIQNTPRQNVETVSRKGITILPFLLSLPLLPSCKTDEADQSERAPRGSEK